MKRSFGRRVGVRILVRNTEALHGTDLSMRCELVLFRNQLNLTHVDYSSRVRVSFPLLRSLSSSSKEWEDLLGKSEHPLYIEGHHLGEGGILVSGKRKILVES